MRRSERIKLKNFYQNFLASTFDWRDYRHHRRVLFNYIETLNIEDNSLNNCYLSAQNSLIKKYDVNDTKVKEFKSCIEQIIGWGEKDLKRVEKIRAKLRERRERFSR